jgi:hypothetical protein
MDHLNGPLMDPLRTIVWPIGPPDISKIAAVLRARPERSGPAGMRYAAAAASAARRVLSMITRRQISLSRFGEERISG